MAYLGLITSLVVAVSLANSAAPLSNNSNMGSFTYYNSSNKSIRVSSKRKSYNSLPPSRHMFGSLDFSLLEEEGSQIPFKLIDKDTLKFEPKGISLSFYLDSIEATEQPQKILSVYGVDLLAYKEKIRPDQIRPDKCSITLVTQLKFNITYSLKGCTRRHIYLDLYDQSQRKTSSLYENLNTVHEETSRGWCIYRGTYLEESKEELYDIKDYSYPSQDEDGNDTIEDVKNSCLTTFIKGEICRGITLMEKHGNYTLRVGDYPEYSFDDETSYLNGPCLDEGRSAEPPSQVLELHNVASSVKLSHINIDPLRDVIDEEEVNRRWKRYELGNMEPGQLVNFKRITYNVDFDENNLHNLKKSKSMYMPQSVSYSNSMSLTEYAASEVYLRRYSNVVISEGMFMQEEFPSNINKEGKFFKVGTSKDAVAANFVWRDAFAVHAELRYCINDESVQESTKDEIDRCLEDINCCGLDKDKLVMTDCSTENAIMRKGFCGDKGAQKEERKFFDYPPDRVNIYSSFGQRIVAHQFRSLPKITGILTSKDKNCNFTSTGGFSNNMTALLAFTTSQDGFRLFIQKTEDKNISEIFVRVNESENQAIMYKMSLDKSEKSISLQRSEETECNLDIITFTADICEPLFTQNNYGYFFLDRGVYNDTVDVPCSADNTKNTSWECDAGTWRQSNSADDECPFYQCYEDRGRRHDSAYTNFSRVYRILKDGNETDGECCGNGRWRLQCEENYSINYDNCTALQSCSATQTLKYPVKEPDGTTSIGSVTVSEFMAAWSQMNISCMYGSGTVEIDCDGCSGKRSVLNNNCSPQICLPDGKTKTEDLTWNLTRNGTHDTKFSGTTFLYTLNGPFRVTDEIKSVTCPHGGEVKLSCDGANIIANHNSCTPAPICTEQEFNLGPLKGSVNFEQIFAGESQAKPCPINDQSDATIFCNSNGEWEGLDHENCEKGPCSVTSFVKNGVRFNITETALDEFSTSTKCYVESCSDGENCQLLDMCSDGTCGTKYCNSSLGGYNTDGNYNTCRFNCTYKEDGIGQVKVIEHGTHKAFECKRKNGVMGTRYVDCHNGEVTKKACVLNTCPYEGGVGCVETDPKALKDADPSELSKDLDSFLESVDLSSEKAKTDTENVVTAIMSNSPDGPKSQEDKAGIAKVIDKVSINLAKSGGKIASKGVTMYGVSASSLRKRSSEKSNYLTENGIVGTGYNGSVGLSIFDDKELFTPKNTTKEKMVSSSVTSITTEFKSNDINVNLSFSQRMDCDPSIMKCRYLDPSTGEWLTDGVKMFCDGRMATCQSTHLTSFAVLVSLDLIDDPEQSIATKIFLTISVACLSATAIAFIPFRKLRNRDIIRIHLCLIVSSIIANLAFLSLEASTGSEHGCYMSTFITHFAWLSVFGWMIAEGVTMYRQTVQALRSYGKKIENYTFKCAMVVHSVSLILPLLGIVLHFTMPEKFQYIRASYEFDHVCFLDTPNTLVYLFLAPLYIVLCLSLYFFIRVSLVVVKSKRQSTSKSVDQGSFWKKQAKAISSIATATGIAWIIAPFVILDNKGGHYSTIMQWVFIIVLGMQGVITFLVLVVLSDEVKNCWRDAYKGSQIEKFGEAFASIGAGLGTLHMRRKSKKQPQTNKGKSREPGTTLFDQTKSTIFFSNLGRSRDFLFHNLFSKAHSSALVNESTHSSQQSNLHNRSNTPNDVFSPVEEVSSIFHQGSDSWVKFVEKAEGGMIPSEADTSVIVRKKDMASDSGFHGDEDMSTSL